MQRILILELLILCFTPAIAQTSWPPVGANWHYSYRPCDMGDCNGLIKEYIFYEAVKDTIVNDTVCTKIKVEYHDDKKRVKYLGDEFLFSEGDQVYNYHHGHFYLLYDFSLQVSDTVVLHLGSNCNIYEQLESSVFDFSDPMPVKHFVINKDSIEIDGKKFLYMDMGYTPIDDRYLFYLFFGNRIVKGIGSLEFLTGKLTNPIESGIYGPLRCYSDLGTKYYSNIPCEELTTLEIFTNVTDISVYPNPVNVQSVIRFPNPEEAEVCIEISNLNGKVVWYTKTCGNNSIIKLDNLPKGIYSYKVYNKDVWIGSGKLVKSDN